MNRLKEARFKRNKSQLELYQEIGIWPCIISWIENGRWNPSDEEEAKLAKALTVERDWLFPKEDSK